MSGVQKLSSLFPVSLQAANNLSDLPNVSSALTALGLGTTAAAELARIGAAPAATAALASDLTRVLQNVLYVGLLVAALRGVPTGLVDGVLDPFSSTADINTGASSGFTFNSSAGTIGATVGTTYTSPYTTVSTSAAAIADSNDGSSPGSAFDGNTSTNWRTGASSSNGVAYIGQDFGAGNAKVISQIILTQYATSTYDATSVLVQGAASSTGPWTTVTTVNGLGAGPTTISVPGSTAYRGWRLLANSAVSNGWAVVEATMQTGTPPTPSAMVLQSASLASAVASPSAARVLVQVDATSAALTANTDLLAFFSRDGGTTFTQGTLGAGQAMPDGTTIYDTGFFGVSGQPAGNSTMTYKLTTPTGRAVVLTGMSMQVKP